MARKRQNPEALRNNTPVLVSFPLKAFPTLTPLEEIEHKSLRFFRTRTAVTFAGYCESSFWDRVILQTSYTEPAVRHAVMALGSLHEFLCSQDAAMNRDTNHDSLRFSLQQYNKAIALITHGHPAGTTPSIEVVLICCALFISIESLQGNYATTRRHILGGSKILADWLSSQGRNTSSALVRDELLPIFVRISTQVKWLTACPFPNFQVYDPDCDSVPISFSSLKEARSSLYGQMNGLFDFAQVDETFLYDSNDVPDNRLNETFAAIEDQNQDESFMFSHLRSPAEIAAAYREKSRLRDMLEGWKASFDGFLLRASSAMDTSELGGAALLQIHYICAWLILETCHSRLQSVFDEYKPQFENMISLSKSLVAAGDTGASCFERTNFWIDMGLIGPVFFAASRCRDPIVRRQAVQILRSPRPRRQGDWDGEAAATVAERIIALEEADLPPVRVAADIPEYARIHVWKVVVSLENRLVILSCYNRHAVSGGRPNFRAVRVKW